MLVSTFPLIVRFCRYASSRTPQRRGDIDTLGTDVASLCCFDLVRHHTTDILLSHLCRNRLFSAPGVLDKKANAAGGRIWPARRRRVWTRSSRRAAPSRRIQGCSAWAAAAAPTAPARCRWTPRSCSRRPVVGRSATCGGSRIRSRSPGWSWRGCTTCCLAGDGADRFAMRQGLTPANLLTEGARAMWQKWAVDHPVSQYLDDTVYFPPTNHGRVLRDCRRRGLAAQPIPRHRRRAGDGLRRQTRRRLLHQRPAVQGARPRGRFADHWPRAVRRSAARRRPWPPAWAS